MATTTSTRGRPVIGKDLKVPMSQEQRDAVAAYAKANNLWWGDKPNLAEAVRRLVTVGLEISSGGGSAAAVWAVPAADHDRVLTEIVDGDTLLGAYGVDEALEVAARELMWDHVSDEEPGPLHRYVVTVAVPGEDTGVWAAASPAAAEAFAIERITALTEQLWTGDEDRPLWAETTIPAGHIPAEAWDHNEHA